MAHYSGHDPNQSTMSEAFAICWRLLLLLGAVYALLVIGAHFYSLRAIFLRPPVKYSMTPEYVQLTTPDGVKLAARHWPNPAAKFTLLYLHGNYQELGSIGEYMPDFVRAGYAVFAFDYRRYGHSGGVPDESNTYADTLLAYEYMRHQLGVPAERIVIFGYSLGGGPGVELALHQPAAGLVLQGVFTSAYRVDTKIPLLLGDKFVNIRKVPQLRLPVLYLHGTADGTVPFSHGEALYAATTARKMKLFVEGGPHGGLADFAGPSYWEALKKFTDSL
jgi:fermentation-respiration switch protein FrsA (DUF1100 family)